MKPLLALVAIVRDEAATIARTLESVRGVVDKITVLDTGSQDGTFELIAGTPDRPSDWGAPTFVYRGAFTDYAAARNAVLDLERYQVHADIDCCPAIYCLSLSADETLHGGSALRAFLETYDGPETCFLIEVRTETDVSQQPRVVETGSPWRYEGAVHERLVNRAEQKDPTVAIPGCWIEHRVTDAERHTKRLREYDVPALEHAIAEGADETERTRHIVLLAQTHENLAAAVADKNLRAYIRHQTEALGLYLWITQRDADKLDAVPYARLHANLISRVLGLIDDLHLLQRLYAIYDVDRNRPDVAFAIAVTAAKLDPRAGYDKAVHAARVARDANGRYALSDPSLRWKAHFLAAACARKTGMGDKARESAEAGVAAGGDAAVLAEFLA